MNVTCRIEGAKPYPKVSLILPSILLVSSSLFSIFFLGNMYFKMIANHPTYKQNNVGGDLTLTSCTKCTDAEVLQGKCNEGDATQGTSLENRNIAVGDVDGKPIPMTGW